MPHRPVAAQIESPVLPFDGGINFLDQSEVKPNQHVRGKNWWRDLDGVVRPRPGNRVWNAASLGTDFFGLWEYRRATDQVNRLIAYAGGTLFKGDDATKAFTVLVTNLTSGVAGFAAQAQDSFWFTNGANTPQVFDSIDTFRIGVIPPSSAPTVALVALAGNLPAEDHYYRYTYVREVAGMKVRESNPSAESAKVTNTAGSAQNDVTVAASTDAQVTHIYIYRRSSVTVIEYKFVAKTTNVTGTYRDNIAVAGLGSFGFWEPSGGEEDHGYLPTDAFAIALHRDGRMYAWGARSRLFYSRPVQYHYYPGAGSVGTRNGFKIIVNEDDGDEGQALLSEADDLWALKRYHVYRLVGDGPTADDGLPGNWKIEQVPTTYGCAAKQSAAVGPAGAYWLSDQGPVRVDTRSGLPRLIGLELKPWLATSTDLTKARGWVWEFYYLLFIPVSGGKWEGMVFDARNGSWWPFADMDAQAFATREDGTLVWGGILEVDKPANGVVYEFNKQTSDNGQVVTAELTTRIIDARPGWWKVLWETILSCEANPGAILTGRLIPDQSNSYVERELKLTAGLTGTRMLKRLRGTKRLQGNAFQFYLKSANLTKRPAIYWWKKLIHTLNRHGTFLSYAEVFTDPDPTVGITEGTFPAGTHTNTRVANGKVTLAEETVWALAYDLPASGPTFMLRGFGGKLLGYAWDSVNTRLLAVWYDGIAWQTAAITPNGDYLSIATINQYDADKRHLLVLGGTAYVAAHDAGSPGGQPKVWQSGDLLTWGQAGGATNTRLPCAIAVHGGLIHVGSHPRIDPPQQAQYLAGGTWTDVGFAARIIELLSAFGVLLFTDQPSDKLRKWNGTAASDIAVLNGVGLAMWLWSKNGRVYIGTGDSALGGARNGRIYEYDGVAAPIQRFDNGSAGKGTMDISEATVADLPLLLAASGTSVYKSEDGSTWTNIGTPLAGQDVITVFVYKGRRYAGLVNGDIYKSDFFKLTGTYRLDERDLGATKTQAQVSIAATVPSGTTLRTRLGYAAVPGGPYTFTAWHTQLGYTEVINGRYLTMDFELTGDGTASPIVDQVEIIAR